MAAGTETPPPARTERLGVPDTNGASDLTITISGPEHAVRRAVTALSFTGEWNRIVTRQIAIDETLVGGAGLDDTLAGSVVHMISQDKRDLYVQRCVDAAKRRGHPVPDPSTIPSDAGTTVMEVGDALFSNSVH